MSSLDYLDLCRLCLVKDRVSVPIFEGEGDVRQIFLKIASCLPVKVTREDKLPKKICDDCVYKVELFYQFWNTTANAEKQLLQWIGEVEMDEKPDYVTEVLNSEQTENRLEMMQSAEEQSNNIEINMMDGMGLGLPIIMSTNEQMSSDPITSSANVQSVQSVGSTTQAHSQLVQKDGTHEEEENTEDECDVDDGMHVKDENDSSVNDSRSMDTSYVSVPLDCDEAGPSGLQQQKLSDMTDMEMAQQSAEGDTKVGCVERLYDESLKSEDIDEAECETEYTEIDYVEDEKELEQYKIIENYSCSTEEVSLVLKDSNDHSSSKNELNKRRKQYKCDKCYKVIRKKMQYLKHIKMHERKTDGTCSHCGLVFPNDKKLEKHIIKVHQEDKPFPCILCGKAFKTEEFLKIHLKQHNKRFICDICGISKVSGYDLRLHKKKHNQEYVTYCEICNKGFYTNQTLERHILTHTREKPFVCKICNTSYASAAYLNMHMKSHGQREKHKCNMCNFESYWKAALKVHLQIHTGENQITCEICGKSVSSKTYLQIHMRIHSGEKPHVCEVCGKAFSVKKYLIVHLRTHTGERPYECKICFKKFTQQGSLNAHVKSHSITK